VKVRSVYKLEEYLDEDLAWRKREFTTLKFMIASARKNQKEVLIRAGITLMYSHWEGHIKYASEIYLRYLNHCAPKYSDMTDNFFQLSLGKEFSNGFSIQKFKSQKEISEYIKNKSQNNFSLIEKNVINTESNLKSEVLINIMNQLGFDISRFELKENFIDETMLKNRNGIAHGERIDANEIEDAYNSLDKELLTMIMDFNEIVKSAAENKTFLKYIA
jgi:hypothetical protein